MNINKKIQKTKDDKIKEEDGMTPPILNRNKLWEVARKNTKKNESGQTTISRNEDSFFDDIWDEIYQKEHGEDLDK